MKKILLATSALSLMAGAAAAEVSISGSARMGLIYNGEDINFTSRARVNFTASGESDSGIAFGYSVRADQAGAANDGMGAGSVFVSGAFGKLSMGDVAGAAEAAVGDLNGVGLTGLGDFSDTVFLTGDGVEVTDDNPVMLYEYSAGAFSGYLSANDGNVQGGGLFGSDASLGDDVQNMAVGVKYSTDAYSFALGYEHSDPVVGESAKHIIAAATGTFGTTTLKAVYGVGDGAIDSDGDGASDLSVDDFKQYGISASSAFGATTVTAFYKKVDFGGAAEDLDAIGLGASYDLGGGASVVGGIVNYDVGAGFPLAPAGGVGTDPSGETVADIGLNFTF